MQTMLVSAKAIGAVLRDMRKQQGLTQKELGRRVGLDQKKVSLIENGNPNIRLDSLLRLLSALGAGITVQVKADSVVAKEDSW
ncbi:MAG: transcriptional regulator [Desulfobulbaceae bacterium BRH_c16a]|jgi:HTH-type transcriptional regulator/antitoxin HipB|nr:MAG: transcriptional regulator [Desulfobulbaceae bacterium BRH_c16a]